MASPFFILPALALGALWFLARQWKPRRQPRHDPRDNRPEGWWVVCSAFLALITVALWSLLPVRKQRDSKQGPFVPRDGSRGYLPGVHRSAK